MSISLTVDKKDYPKIFDLTKTKQKEVINEMLKIGYQVLYPKVDLTPENNMILNKLNEIERNSPNIEDLNQILSKLLGISNNSSLKGELGEGVIEQLIRQKYPLANYQVTRSVAHCGDGILELPNNKIMIEVKNYQITVPQKEVEKMKYDMKYNKIEYGLMVSLSSKILNSNNFDLETFVENEKTYYLVKINHLSSDVSRLDTGLNLLENIMKLYDENKTKLIINENFKKHFDDFVSRFNENFDLRNEYLQMESSIKNSMECFYQKMRNLHLEQESLLKKLTEDLNKEIINVITIPDEIEIFNDSKIYPKILKLMDFLTKNHLEFSLDKNKIKCDLGEIKINKDKFTFSLLNPEINLIFTYNKDDTKTWKILESLI